MRHSYDRECGCEHCIEFELALSQRVKPPAHPRDADPKQVCGDERPTVQSSSDDGII